MSLTIAAMVRNEAGRFLPQALSAWGDFADDIVILNDGSTDDTRSICKDAGAFVIDAKDDAPPAWGTEAPVRAQLWEAAWNTTRIGSYILVLDADMVPARSPRMLMETEADGVMFYLYDLWSKDTYRDDNFWSGHLRPRLWMVKKTSGLEDWAWNSRGIHSGHFPLNLACDTFAYAPQDFSLLHYAYATPELRDDKYTQYASVSASLTDHERAHAISIRDVDPVTRELPFTPTWALI